MLNYRLIKKIKTKNVYVYYFLSYLHLPSSVECIKCAILNVRMFLFFPFRWHSAICFCYCHWWYLATKKKTGECLYMSTCRRTLFRCQSLSWYYFERDISSVKLLWATCSECCRKCHVFNGAMECCYQWTTIYYA